MSGVCGRMVDVGCGAGGAPFPTAASNLGYEIDEAEIIYRGGCPECRDEKGTT